MKNIVVSQILSFISFCSLGSDWSKADLSINPLKGFNFLKTDEFTCCAFSIHVAGTAYSPVYSSHIFITIKCLAGGMCQFILPDKNEQKSTALFLKQ